MCVIESTSSLLEVASASSSHHFEASQRDDETEASDVPAFIYIKTDEQQQTLSAPSKHDSVKPSKSSIERRVKSLSSPKVVSICTAEVDEQRQASIPTEEIASMKRMIEDIKHNPDMIYKRLCVRYPESTIRRGKSSMEEVMGRCGGVRRVSCEDPDNRSVGSREIDATKADR